MPRPLLVFSASFILGVYLGAYLNVSLMVLLSLAILLLVTAACTYLTGQSHTSSLLLVVCLLIGMFTTGLSEQASTTSLVNWAGQNVTVTGQIVQEPDVRPDKVFYVLDIQEISSAGKHFKVGGLLRLTVHQPENIYIYRDIIKATAQLQVPSPPGNPGQFDYQKYLARRGIHVTMSVWQPEQVVYLDTEAGGFIGLALKAKKQLQNILHQTLPPEQCALVQGMLFGTKGMITAEITSAFQTASLVHILCVSGFHVGLVLGAALLFLHLLRIPRQWQAPLCTLLIFFYAAITGFGPAVLRATIMGLLVLWARHFGRERDWPTAMVLAAAVILFIWPGAIWEPGFQLSFMVTWGILYLAPLFKPANRWGRLAALVLTVPVVAEITAAPLVAYHFNMVSLVGIVANVITAPLLAVVMLLSGVSVLVGLLFTPLAALINTSTIFLLDIILWIVQRLTCLPHAAIFLPSPPWWGVVCIYILLATAAFLLKHKRISFTRSAKYLLPIAVLLIILFFSGPKDTGWLTVHFIDVGQGDAALVQTPGGCRLLIDSGGWTGELAGGSGAGSSVVLPYLKRQGVNNLDVLILSHPHEDHVGGVWAVASQIPVELVITAPVDKDVPEVEPAYWELLHTLSTQATVQQAKAGQSIKLDRTIQVDIISPGAPVSQLNDGSLVVKITYQHVTLLFTGDIERERQKILVAENNNLQADILKVPHHGSGNLEPEFFQAVKPTVAVISVGQKNRFGHPSPAVLQFLENMHTKIYRTDQHGAVVLKTDGRAVWVDTSIKSER